MSDPQKVEAGQVYIDTKYEKTRRRLTEHGDVEVEDGNGGWVSSAVSEENFRRYVASGEFVPENPPTPDPRDAVIDAARKAVPMMSMAWQQYGVGGMFECMDALRAAIAALDAANAASPK